MNFKVGDKVNVYDGSYSFGVYDGEYCGSIPHPNCRDNLTIVKTGLSVMERAEGKRHGEYREVCDLLVTDSSDGFWFIRSDFCRLIDKKIELRYYCDGQDVTDSISEETKRNLNVT